MQRKAAPKRDPQNLARELTELRVLIDELGDIESRRLSDKDEKRARAIKAELQVRANRDYPPDQPVSFDGIRYSVFLTARRNKRSIISLDRLFDFLGRLRFLARASFTLTAVDEAVEAGELTPGQVEEILNEELHSGERIVKAVPRAVPNKAAA